MLANAMNPATPPRVKLVASTCAMAAVADRIAHVLGPGGSGLFGGSGKAASEATGPGHRWEGRSGPTRAGYRGHPQRAVQPRAVATGTGRGGAPPGRSRVGRATASPRAGVRFAQDRSRYLRNPDTADMNARSTSPTPAS